MYGHGLLKTIQKVYQYFTYEKPLQPYRCCKLQLPQVADPSCWPLHETSVWLQLSSVMFVYQKQKLKNVNETNLQYKQTIIIDPSPTK